MFFSVKSPVKIMGKTYTPCVCYALPDILIPTVDKMVAEDRAYKFENKVYFQNGKVLEKKEVVKENLTAEKPKKQKKEKTVEVKDTEDLIKEADIASPEEVADDMGGF